MVHGLRRSRGVAGALVQSISRLCDGNCDAILKSHQYLYRDASNFGTVSKRDMFHRAAFASRASHKHEYKDSSFSSVYLKLLKGIIKGFEKMNRKSNWARKTNARCHPKCLREIKNYDYKITSVATPCALQTENHSQTKCKRPHYPPANPTNFFPACQTSIMRDSMTSQCSDWSCPHTS